MAYDVFQSRGPSVSLSLFGDAASQGTNIGKAVPSITSSIIQGAKEGFDYAQSYEAKQIQNENNAAIAEQNRIKAENAETDIQLDQQQQQEQIRQIQLNNQIKQNELEAAKLTKAIDNEAKLLKSQNDLEKTKEEALVLSQSKEINNIMTGINPNTGEPYTEKEKADAFINPKYGKYWSKNKEYQSQGLNLYGDSSLYDKEQKEVVRNLLYGAAEEKYNLLMERKRLEQLDKDAQKKLKTYEDVQTGALGGAFIKAQSYDPNLTVTEFLTRATMDSSGGEYKLKYKATDGKEYRLDEKYTAEDYKNYIAAQMLEQQENPGLYKSTADLRRSDPLTTAKRSGTDISSSSSGLPQGSPVPSPGNVPTPITSSASPVVNQTQEELVRKANELPPEQRASFTERMKSKNIQNKVATETPTPTSTATATPTQTAPIEKRAAINESEISPLQEVGNAVFSAADTLMGVEDADAQERRKVSVDRIFRNPLPSYKKPEEKSVKTIARSINKNPLLRDESPLVKAVLAVESAGGKYNKSPTGVIGPMQVTDDAIADVEKMTGKSFDKNNTKDNIEAGKIYLNYLINYFEGDITLALAAYNGGMGRIDAARDALNTNNFALISNYLKYQAETEKTLTLAKAKEIAEYPGKVKEFYKAFV